MICFIDTTLFHPKVKFILVSPPGLCGLTSFLCNYYYFLNLFIYFWLYRVFVAVHGLLIAVASLAAITGSRRAGVSSCGTRAQ